MNRDNPGGRRAVSAFLRHPTWPFLAVPDAAR